MDLQTEAMFDVAAPAVAPGTVRVRAAELRTALGRLLAFPTKDKKAPAACRHLWLYCANRRFVGLATDLAATGQVDLPVMAGDTLPLFGVTAGAAARLREPLAKVKSVVTVTVADGAVTLLDGDDQIAAQQLYLPTPIDLSVLAQVGDRLALARAAAETSELPHGTIRINPRLQARFAEAGHDARFWYAPHGAAYVEVDERFRGYVQAARPTPAGARRPLPAGQPYPAIPTRSAA